MTPATPIRPAQRKKLIVLWKQYYARENWTALDERQARLQWLSTFTQRPIPSANDLQFHEATRAISALNKLLGLPAHQPRDRSRAQAAGTHGRRGHDRRSDELAGSEDLARIERAIERLGWDRSRFDAWLQSPSSPLGRKRQIRTVGDANRVWWALKRFLQREGKWEED